MRHRFMHRSVYWTLAFGAACSILAFGIHWQRGPYHDDHFLYSWSFSKLIAFIGAEVRPLGKLIGAFIFSQPEIHARFFASAMLVGTALLAALFVHRVTQVRLAAVVAGLLCLAPLFGIQATTWTNAVIHYLPAGFLVLLAANLYLSSVRVPDSSFRSMVLAGSSGILLVLAFCCIEPAANFWILFLGLTLVRILQSRDRNPSRLLPLVIATLVMMVALVAIYAVFYVDANQLTRRGEIAFPDMDRVRGFLLHMHDLGLGGTFGRDILSVSYAYGWGTLLSNPVAALVALLALLTGAVLNLSWMAEPAAANSKNERALGAGIMLIASSLAAIASLLIPAVLLTEEKGSPRLGYLPGLGIILATGFLVAMTVLLWRNKALERVILLTVTVCVLVLSVRALGYTRLYQVRRDYSEMQLQALLRAVPKEAIAGVEVTMLPFQIAEDFIDYPVRIDPKHILMGYFTGPNAIGTVLRGTYPESRLHIVRPGYGRARWVIEKTGNQTLSLSGYTVDPTWEVPPEQLIVFRFEESGIVDVAAKIEFRDRAGSVIDEVLLPWGIELNRRYGTEIFTLDIEPSGK